MAKGETERENSKQMLEIIFYLNRFTSHRATKTWGGWKLFYPIFSVWQYVRYQNDSKWFTSESFDSLFIWNDHQQAITSDSASEFRWQPVLNNTPTWTVVVEMSDLWYDGDSATIVKRSIIITDNWLTDNQTPSSFSNPMFTPIQLFLSLRINVATQWPS